MSAEFGDLPPPGELAPLICRHCGGPLSPTLRGCSYCGGEVSLDPAVRATMRRRAGRVRRYARKLQSTMRYHLRAVVAPRSRWLIRIAAPLDLLWLFLLVPGSYVAPFVALVVGFTLLRDAGMDKTTSVAVASIPFIVLSVLGVAVRSPWLDRLFAPFGRAAMRALAIELHQLLASCEPHIHLTQRSLCGSCGAHFSSAVVAQQTTVECPFCRAPLILTGQSLQGAADDALRAAHQEAQVAMPGSFAERLDPVSTNAELMELIGYRRVGGLYQSSDGRVSVHHRDQPPMRIDVDIDTPLLGRSVLIATTRAGSMDAVLAELGEMPPSVVRKGGGLMVLRDEDLPAEALALPEIERLLAKLEPGEAVLFDGAGATFLRASYVSEVDQLTQRVTPLICAVLERLAQSSDGPRR